MKKKVSAKKSRHSRGSSTKSGLSIPKTEDGVHKTKMRIIGVGGGAGSIISEISSQLKKIDFVTANTDLQALKAIKKKAKIFQFGQNLTHGLGCGMDPKVGQKSAHEAKQKISQLLKEVDLAIFVACLGGGTGSGAAPEFIKIAKELGVMSFGIFTLPFKFEGAKRAQIARASLERAIPNLNAFSVIPNENIFQIINKDTPIIDAFSAVNKRLSENLRGLIEMIYFPGIVNIDFADLKTILDGKGKLTYLNTAYGQGENRAEESIKELLSSPLNEYTIDGAEKIVFNITASKDLGMMEVEAISRAISDFNRRAKIIFGVSQDGSYNDKLRITLLAVGVGVKQDERRDNKIKPKQEPKQEPKPEQKTQPKTQLKSKKSKKPTIKKKEKKAPVSNPSPAIASVFTRKNALDLKKDTEKTEQELLEAEEKWNIPAFLRRQNNL
ncbi:MAG: hypothetical protein HYV47_00255 [Candidatus Nealsonbacteria bacterium]|nr:hypothetical protein [Candidatus Nealsonbacteria bacterium]